LGRFVLLGELSQIDAVAAARVETALLRAYSSADNDASVQRRILEALAFSSNAQVQGLIEDAYDSDEESMRASALFAMGRSADACWKEIVLSELAGPDNVMRYEAARASGELELSDAVPDLIKMVQEEDVELRDAAISALGRIGGPEARRVLRACCESEDEDLQEVAEDALAELDFLTGDDDLPAFFFDS